jgi:hypothetical protein
MDVTKMPAPASAPARTTTAPPAEQGPQSAPSAAPIADRADIRPLDVPAALQILLAEVRAAFELLALAIGEDAGDSANSPPQAARAVLQMVLRAVPDETASTPVWNVELARVETALQTGLDRGMEAVTLWRDVPPIVVEAAQEAHGLVFSALDADPQNPAWLRPEWVGLAPEFERFSRRRRVARRRLSDPDYSSGRSDDDIDQRS